MANYLALIRKADFVDLFKYGSLHVNRDMVRQFSCKVEELPDRQPIFDDLSYYSNAFDSTFTYLFIHYEKNLGRVNDINIADVRGIYPLDKEAKKELSLSLDPRIKINDPLWADAVFNLQKKQTIQDSKNGASNIWKIYSLSDSIDDIKQIVTDEALSEVINELYDNRRPEGKQSIWVYIMRYERHAFYPNNSIGAFMDAVNAIFNYFKGRDVDSEEIESEMIMKFFSFCNERMPNIQFSDILHKLSIQTEPNIIQFLSKVRAIDANIDVLKVASLFFIYRNQYKVDFYYDEKWETAGKKNGKEFAIACYMLGCILGHEHTYDCLYEHLPLAIFKTKGVEHVLPTKEITRDIEDKKNIKELPSDRQNNDSTNEKSEGDKPEGEKQVMPKLPCKMGVPKKGGGFKKSPKPQEVRTLEKYLELRAKGWVIIKENIELW